MSLTKSKITKALYIQECHQGLTDDIRILKWFAGIAKTSMQWQLMVKVVDGYRYGKYSYQTERFYAPTDELRIMSVGIDQ